MVERLYQCLMTEIFPAAIRNDARLVATTKAFAGAVEFRGDELYFTLPALFDFLTAQMSDWPAQDKADRRREYLRFRKIIYKNPTNETLGKQGAEVEIAYSHEDHERTVYRLVRKQDEK